MSTEVLPKLGLPEHEPSGEVNFLDTNKSDDLFIGTYEDNIIIVNPSMVYQLLSTELPELGERFITSFPTAEIAVLAENSTVAEFGYAIIDRGRRVRVKHGCDGEIYVDIGDLLAEEKEIMTGAIFSPEELEEMREDMDEDEVQEMIDFEASWRVSSEISKRYLGEDVESLSRDAIRFTRYKKA